MQPQQCSRIDLAELKAHIVKKIGADRSKRYFYYLSRFLSQKLSKNEFDKSCYRILGKDNLPLHNQLIRAILKNACQAKSPPPVHEAGLVKSSSAASKLTPCRENGPEQIEPFVPNGPNQIPSLPTWSNSNGVLPVSPRKIRSGMRDRKVRERPSALAPNGTVATVLHHSASLEDNGNKLPVENGELTPYDYYRPVQHLQSLAAQPEMGNLKLADRAHAERNLVEECQEVERSSILNISRSPLVAPLGIPLCSSSLGGVRKAVPVTSSEGFMSNYDCGMLSDTETLRKRMDQIAEAHNLEGVSLECANMLNNMLDVYLKKLIKSCIDLVTSRSPLDLRRRSLQKQLVQGKVVNGLWPNSHLHWQNTSGPVGVVQEQRPHRAISLLDFKVAMELNPQQLGEDWPLLLERICLNSFEQ